MAHDLDDILGSMHRDKSAISDATLQDIDEKIQRRREAGNELIQKLEEQLRELTQQTLHLMPEGGMFDTHRRERQGLEREFRDREITLAMEKLQLTRDVSFLEQERRRVKQYVMQEQQLHERMQNAFYDS